MTIGQLMGLAVLGFLLDGFALWIRSVRFAGEARVHVQIGAAYVFTTTVVLGNLWLILLGRCAKVFRPTRRPWDRALVDGNRKNFCHFT